ncbi:MAG: alpha/beta hydrolase family protein, partial [Micromonosporaceae bacterium]
DLLAARLPAGVPVGLWGFSQGAWVAPLAATASPDVRFLILIAATGVSPAAQMRYAAAEHLRRAGYDREVQASADGLRREFEAYLRRERTRQQTQPVLDRYAGEPWYPLTFLPTTLPDPGTWDDMDFDPVPTFAAVPCPVLAFYGEVDEWTPVDASVDAWHHAVRHGPVTDVTVVRLPGAGHAPVDGGGDGLTPGPISQEYAHRTVDWLGDHLA